MKAPETIQDEIIDEFNAQGEAFEQFDYLLKLAAELDEMPETDKVSEVLVDGCQSQVWLYLDWVDKSAGESFHLRGDSDTLMVRGIIRILELMFNGQTARAVANCPIEFVEKTELIYIFDSKRQAGVASIVGDIKDFAQAAFA